VSRTTRRTRHLRAFAAGRRPRQRHRRRPAPRAERASMRTASRAECTVRMIRRPAFRPRNTRRPDGVVTARRVSWFWPSAWRAWGSHLSERELTLAPSRSNQQPRHDGNPVAPNTTNRIHGLLS
jgi:hypothetical protein